MILVVIMFIFVFRFRCWKDDSMQKYLYIEEKNRSFRPISMCFCMNIDENRTFFRCVAIKNDVFLWHTSSLQTMLMKRFAFKMLLKPGCEKEYERRHYKTGDSDRRVIHLGNTVFLSVRLDHRIESREQIQDNLRDER